MIIDLHCHSTVSDGLLAPADVVERAAGRGVKVLALTDHDDIAGLAEAQASAERNGICFIPGVEISVTWRQETLHIVGLRIDPDNSTLLEGLRSVRSGRVDRAKKMAYELEKIGIKGSLAGAYRFVTSETMISRTHFARFLIEAGHAKDMKGVFKKYLAKGKPGYVPHQWTTLEDAINWIRAAGGSAVIAHPGRYKISAKALRELLTEFKELGGAAIEVVTGSHTPDQYALFAAHAQTYGLLSSCGSDFHAPAESRFDLGQLPALPANCTPVWHDWPEVARQLSSAGS